MPSIPQSLLWISLVVLWLFVLVPMLINKRDTVRRTSDVALATRVLNGGRSRLLRRTGPATGHRHDPLWRDGEPDLGETYDNLDSLEPEDYEDAVRAAVDEARARAHDPEIMRERHSTASMGAPSTGAPSMMVVAADAEAYREAEANTEPVYIDVDIVDENSGALTVGTQIAAEGIAAEGIAAEGIAADGVQASLFDEPGPDPAPEVSDTGPVAAESGAADEYEYVEDSSGLESDDGDLVDPVAAARSKRRRMESTTAEAVSARKYRFRKRMLTAMAAVMVATAVASFVISAAFWWSCGAAATVTILYLAYLRRQTRIEEQVRRRRQQRMARSRSGRQPTDGYADRYEDGYPGRRAGDRGADPDLVGSRLRRPGAVVLDIDDEDPAFEHLDEVAYSRRYDLPRAAGQ